MPSCIHCGGRGEVYDYTCGAWEPCPVKCAAWFRVVADDAVLESLETAYVPDYPCDCAACSCRGRVAFEGDKCGMCAEACFGGTIG